jgi:hypothetical protein
MHMLMLNLRIISRQMQTIRTTIEILLAFTSDQNGYGGHRFLLETVVIIQV